ncbi:MAG: hypothetical protein DRP97_00445 [Candidatus Latescibacterota bacterium]|nr:MAG: hypothetical protein DRP97_00445 [Candidatus Latescibacterota bacterium]
MNNRNTITGFLYGGRNQAILCEAREKNGYKSDQWGTFLQWQMAKRQIVKGSKGVSIFKGYRENEKGESVSMGYARIFNKNQTKERATK